MDRYRKESAIEKIGGYFLPKPEQEVGLHGGIEAAFVSAQSECVRHIQAQIDDIRSLTFEQFRAKGKK